LLSGANPTPPLGYKRLVILENYWLFSFLEKREKVKLMDDAVLPMDAALKRCWITEKPFYTRYHDEEWGVPLHDDKKLFELLILEGFQAGLSWWLILKRRNMLRKAFDNFDPEKVAKYSSADISRIMNAPGVIKNKAKIASAVNNAQQSLKIQTEFGTFDAFIWQFVKGKAINNKFNSFSEIPAQTEESRVMSRELKRRGFKFVGPTICYAFMQAAGLVNDHQTWCFRYEQIRNAENTFP
jgi:DNA-3-methyladenine glycosylase I